MAAVDFGTLDERVAWFSRTPCTTTDVSSPPTDVVLVPPDRPAALGWHAALSLLEEGSRTVRVVATYAALPSTWPPWVTRRPGIVATDIGAYRARSRIDSTRDVAADIRAWLSRAFGDLGGIPAGWRALYGEASERVFDEIFLGHPFVAGLAAGLAGCDVRCVERWPLASRLDELLRRSGGQCRSQGRASEARKAPFTLDLAARSAVLWAGASAELVNKFVRARPSRAALREQGKGAANDPPVWVLLLPTWWRMNRHVIQSVVLDRSRRRAPFGTLLFGDLARGARNEHRLSVLEGHELWPGFGPGREAVLASPLDQVAMPETAADLVAATFSSAAHTARAVARIAREPVLRVGGHHVDLRGKRSATAHLVGVATTRAAAVQRQAEKVARRHRMAGVPVVFATSGLVETSMADLVLQRAGATTVDFVHGTKGDGVPGATESVSSVQFVWTESDREAVAGTGQPCVVAGMPAPVLSPRVRHGLGSHVLIMSAYLHRDDLVHGEHLHEPALHELLAIVDTFAADERHDVTFRWRPHPADDPQKVDRVRGMHAATELSRGTPLAEDLAWCDAVVTVHSSAMFEAMFADVPIFLQALPGTWGTAITSPLDRERVFHWSEDGAGKLAACLAALRAGDPGTLEPERAARRRLFGPTGEPETVSVALARLTADATPRVVRARSATPDRGESPSRP